MKWKLADYEGVEQRAGKQWGGWQSNILFVLFDFKIKFKEGYTLVWNKPYLKALLAVWACKVLYSTLQHFSVFL